MTSVCSRPAPLACLAIRKPLRFWPRARNQAKTRQGPSFAQQKFFAPCLKSLVLSECGGAKEGEGGRPDMGVCAMSSGWLDELPCYECEFEPKTVGPNVTTRMIARMTKAWSYRSSPQVASNRRTESPCGGFSVAALSASSSACDEDSLQRHTRSLKHQRLQMHGLMPSAQIAQRRTQPRLHLIGPSTHAPLLFALRSLSIDPIVHEGLLPPRAEKDVRILKSHGPEYRRTAERFQLGLEGNVVVG